jgi:Ca2+-binding RTX toxin-like protein
VFLAGQTAAARSGGAALPEQLTCGSLVVTIVGTSGDDVIEGTAGHDVIAGLQGDDEIRGGDGEDTICGGPGDDYIEGQGDEDRLFGDQGDDILDGGEAGCCTVFTNTGDDVISGGPGNDELHSSDFPQAGNSMYGDEGADTIFVWRGGLAIGAMNHVYGGNGDDTIYQYSGDATIDGGSGNDVIVDWDDAGLTDETVVMIGGQGSDELTSEDATSTADMDGGQGPDLCVAGDTTIDCESGPPVAEASQAFLAPQRE